MPNQSNQSNARSNVQPKDMSQDAFIQRQGFRNFPEFLLSYGLKINNPDDVSEGKQILDALRQAQQEQYEEEIGRNAQRS